ncbi:MAG: zf-HC2 domain-containing protein [Candidatus Bipolaricaulia bacterium]
MNREKLDHQGIIELLSLYIKGTLTEQEHERVEAHLAGCEACRNELEFLQDLQAAVTTMTEIPTVSPNLLERTADRIRERNRVVQEKFWKRWLASLGVDGDTVVVRLRVRTAIAIAGIALVFFGLGLFLGQQLLSDRSVEDQVATSKEILFAYHTPQAEAVYLVGSFNGWQVEVTPMERGREGIWTVTVALEPGRYEYMFIVDGEWVTDPNAPRTADSGFGVKNGIINVAGSEM